MFAVSSSSSPVLPAPAGLWRASELSQEALRTVGTGHAALDAVLPGGGWPVGALVEVLQAPHRFSEWSLLAPMLSRCAGVQVLVGAPHPPFGPALAGRGVDPQRLLWVQGSQPALQLWAAEQALRCADVELVLAWLPRIKMAQARRLAVAAQAHQKLLFVFRAEQAQCESSPAMLRLLLEADPGGARPLRLRILKRRGPPLVQAVHIDAGPARLDALLAASRARHRPMEGVFAAPAAFPVEAALAAGKNHALDRTASLAA